MLLKSFVLLLIFNFLGNVSCQIKGKPSPASATTKPKIIGGQPAARGQFPHQVSIQIKNGQHFCGGSIIDENHILTAAHCFTDTKLTAQDIIVWTGEVDLTTDGGTDMEVIQIISHEFNIKTKENDLAVLKLAKNITFTDAAKPVVLNDNNYDVDTNCQVSGWGFTEPQPPTENANDVLMYVDVVIKDHAKCYKGYQEIPPPEDPITITDKMLCAGNPGKDSCKGDSGGPLICNNKLVGVVSFGYSCALEQFPGVYTNVALYKEWIENQLNGAHGLIGSYIINIISFAAVLTYFYYI